MSDTLRTLGAVFTLRMWFFVPPIRWKSNGCDIAAVCSWRLALSSFNDAEKEKTWKRVVFDAIYRYLIYTQSIDQLAYIFPGTEEVYKAWVKKKSLPETIDLVGEDAKLLWIGPKATSKVIIYLHGGGFSLAMPEDSCSFWSYVRQQLGEKAGIEASIAIVKYSTTSFFIHSPIPDLSPSRSHPTRPFPSSAPTDRYCA